MGSLNAENTMKLDLDDSGCVQDALVGDNGRNFPQLMDLSDDVLLYILQYLTPRDLKALGHTCSRLGALICDRTLWTQVDARTSPMGQERLKWLLTHCLSAATTELKIAGFANKFSRCLGIQDLHCGPVEADQDFIRGTCIGSQEGVDVEHFLLRMWYPHLPRFAVSPRWPDTAEAEIKTAKAEADKKAAEADEKAEADKKAAEAAASKSEEAPSAGNSGKNSEKPGNVGQTPDISGQSADLKAGQSSSSFGLNSVQNGGQNSSAYGVNGDHGSKMENKDDYPILFEDEIRDDCKGPQFTLTKKLMFNLKNTCSNLTSLAVEYCNLDYRSTNLRHFPNQLKKLSLRGSRVYNLPLNTSYLGKVQERLPGLEYLDVSECDWFEPASLMPLSKLAGLTELYMRDCKRLTECVAYASLATRYGFRKLRVFDVRGSPLADSEVSALGWLPRLEELYVSPPEDYSNQTEHTHSWSTANITHNELDAWEQEEPEYFKNKEPEQDYEPDDKDEEPDERHGDVMFSNPWWSHERRIIVIQPNANRQLEEHYPLMQRQPPNIAVENPRVPPQMGPRIPRAGEPPVEDIPVPPGGLPPIRCVPGSIDIVPGDLIPRPVRQYVPLEPPRPGPVNPKPVPTDPRDDSLLRQGTARVKTGTTNQPGPSNSRQKDSGPSNLQAGPAIYRPSSVNLHPCAPHARPGPSNPQAGPPMFGPGPVNPQAGIPHPRPGPGNPQSGSSNVQAGPETNRAVSANSQAGPSYHHPAPAYLQPGPPILRNSGSAHYITANLLAGLALHRPDPLADPRAGYPQAGYLHPQACYSNQRPSSANAEAGPSNPQPGPSNSQAGPSNSQPGPSNSQPGPSNSQQGPSNSQQGPSNSQPGPSNSKPGPSNSQPGPSNQSGLSNAEKRRIASEAVDLAKRRRIEEENEEIGPINPNQAVPVPLPEACPRLRPEVGENPEQQAERQPACVRFRRHALRPIMHVDVDIHRHTAAQIGAHVGYHLVSDSALLRFGRADNDNVNYVHIGRNGIPHGSELGSRPDRSNLRILSVTGYRNITDRSLQHLVTAAPYLLHIDFTETNVTPRGVELFKAIRPECEVIYSQFSRMS